MYDLLLIRENMTYSALDEASWNVVKSENSSSEITNYFPIKVGRKIIMGRDLRHPVGGSVK